MAQDIIIKAEKRVESGSGAAKNLRREGRLPCIVYGSGKEAAMIQINEHEFEQLLRHHASENLIIDLAIDSGKAAKVLLKDVQHHPVSGRILHADFHEISMKDKLIVEVPIELVGDPQGVVKQGGVLEHLLRELEVECLPGDIPELVELDVSALEIGDSLNVEDIQIDTSKLTVLTPPDMAVAAVAAPRVEEEPEEEEEGAEGELAEPEVIGEKKEGDEEEESDDKSEG